MTISTHQFRGPTSALDTVRDALQAAGQAIRPRGADSFMASCPLHTDHSPSLSVGWRESTRAGRGGAVLLHCFSCQAPAAGIAAAVGLRLADLFDNASPTPTQCAPPLGPGRPGGHFKPARPAPILGPLPPRITATQDRADHMWRRVRVYTYTTAEGKPVQQVIRQECSCNGQPHKRFRQRYRDGRQWVYRKPDGFTPVLYRATAVSAAAKTGAGLWLTEGEKDADTLTTLGRLATTNAQGAANFPAELLAQFTGLNVAIVADRDLAGYRRALTLYQQLQPVANQVAVLVPGLKADKSDVTDHVEARLWRADEPYGGLIEVTIDELHALTLAAAARWAGDRFDTALTEARAHQDRRGTVPGSARNAARWLAEAAEQLRTVQSTQRDLQQTITQHPSPAAHAAADTVAALLDRLTTDYRHSTCRSPTVPPAGTGTRLKETA